jgi:hypothetical protein
MSDAATFGCAWAFNHTLAPESIRALAAEETLRLRWPDAALFDSKFGLVL